MNHLQPIRARIPRFLGIGVSPPVIPKRIVPRLIQTFPVDMDLRPVVMSGATTHIPAPVPPPLSISSFQASEAFEGYGYSMARARVSAPLKPELPRIQIIVPTFFDDPIQVVQMQAPPISATPVSEHHLPGPRVIQPVLVDDWDWMVYGSFRHTVFTHFPGCHPQHGRGDQSCGERSHADETCGHHGHADESCGPHVKTDACCP